MSENELPANLVEHKIAYSPDLPPVTALKCEYLTTAGGVMIRARRDGLEVCLPVAVSPAPINGLAEVEPYIALDGGRVPADLLRRMIERGRAVCRSPSDHDFLESLFYLSDSGETREWTLTESEQERRHGAVRPLDDSDGSAYSRALIEIHTHPKGYPNFSPQDDEEESGKFRIFGVFSDLFERVSFRVRVGVFDHFCEVPADWIFEMPEGLRDLMLEEALFQFTAEAEGL